MSSDEYEAIPEVEWKVLATTEITHLTDEEKDYLPHAWDEWIARVRRDAAREALDGLAEWFQETADLFDERSEFPGDRARRDESLNRKAETLAYRDIHCPEETHGR